MKAAGQLSAEEESAGKIPKNVITRSLGPYSECNVDLEGPFPVQVGDTFLLCSDGLTGVISDAEIGAILANFSPDEAARVLIDLANLRGGPDNITVVVVKVIHSQLTTNGNTLPVKVHTKKPGQPVWPFLWAIFAGATFFTLLFWYWSGWKSALLPGIVSAGSFLFIAIRLIIAASSGQTSTTNRRFGKGPYTRVGCALGPQFSKQLAEMLNQLQTGAIDQDWKIDWDQLNALIAEAEAASANNNHSQSIQSYGRAVSFLMDQLRNQNDASSSSIEL